MIIITIYRSRNILRKRIAIITNPIAVTSTVSLSRRHLVNHHAIAIIILSTHYNLNHHPYLLGYHCYLMGHYSPHNWLSRLNLNSCHYHHLNRHYHRFHRHQNHNVHWHRLEIHLFYYRSLIVLLRLIMRQDTHHYRHLNKRLRH